MSFMTSDLKRVIIEIDGIEGFNKYIKEFIPLFYCPDCGYDRVTHLDNFCADCGIELSWKNKTVPPFNGVNI